MKETTHMDQQKHKPKWDERTRRNYVAGWQRGASGEKPNPLLATKVYMSGFDAGRQALADAKSASYIIGGLIENFCAPVESCSCWLCGGSGRDPHFKVNTCPECRGSGDSGPL